MRYLVLLAGDGEEAAWASLTEAEQGQLIQRFEDFSAACAAADGVEILGGAALQPASTASTVRTRDGEQIVTEGPYAEAYEGLGGFYLLEVPSLDVLLELVRRLPRYDLELRPVDESMQG